MNYRCTKCGKLLTKDDIGASKKFINRGAKEFICIDCLAGHFKCPVGLIQRKIEYFKSIGCSLFN